MPVRLHEAVLLEYVGAEQVTARVRVVVDDQIRVAEVRAVDRQPRREIEKRRILRVRVGDRVLLDEHHRRTLQRGPHLDVLGVVKPFRGMRVHDHGGNQRRFACEERKHDVFRVGGPPEAPPVPPAYNSGSMIDEM
jgi:co-chaperonin GroES (HSP10)